MQLHPPKKENSCITVDQLLYHSDTKVNIWMFLFLVWTMETPAWSNLDSENVGSLSHTCTLRPLMFYICHFVFRCMCSHTGSQHSEHSTQAIRGEQKDHACERSSAIPESSRQIWRRSSGPVYRGSDWTLLLGGWMGWVGPYSSDV